MRLALSACSLPFIANRSPGYGFARFVTKLWNDGFHSGFQKRVPDRDPVRFQERSALLQGLASANMSPSSGTVVGKGLGQGPAGNTAGSIDGPIRLVDGEWTLRPTHEVVGKVSDKEH